MIQMVMGYSIVIIIKVPISFFFSFFPKVYL